MPSYEYRPLTGTGISVSNLALGTRGFGSETAENDVFGILDRSFATGDSRNSVSKRVGLVRLFTVGYRTRPTVWVRSRRLDFFVPSEVGRKGDQDKRGRDEKGKEPSRAATPCNVRSETTANVEGSLSDSHALRGNDDHNAGDFNCRIHSKGEMAGGRKSDSRQEHVFLAAIAKGLRKSGPIH